MTESHTTNDFLLTGDWYYLLPEARASGQRGSGWWGKINLGDKPGETTIEIHGVWRDGVAYPVEDTDCADSTNTDNRDGTGGNT